MSQQTLDEFQREVATDGGLELPEDEPILLIQGITRITHTPEIVEGRTSSTGKTIAVEDKHGSKSYRLDTETILTGGTEFRDATKFELYTPDTFERRQRTNHQPGPCAGVNEVTEAENLPEPTHEVVDAE